MLPAFSQALSSDAYAAQVVMGRGFSTHVTLANIGSSRSLGASLRLFDEQGLVVEHRGPVTVVGRTVHLEKARTLNLAEEFGLDEGELMVATLLVRPSEPGLIGNVIVSHQRGSRIASAVAFPLRQTPVRQAVFGQIASNLRVFTGLALFNPGPLPTNITLQAFAGDGTLLEEKSLNLAPQRRTAQLLREFLPESGQLDGFLRLRSSQPILAEQIIGDFNGDFLSAVPAFVIE